MRALYVIQRYYPFSGGSERYFQRIAERLVGEGGDADVLTTEAWDLERFWDPRKRRVDEPESVHNGVAIHRLALRYLPAPQLSHRAIRRLMAESCRVSFPGQRALLRAGGRFGPWVPGLVSAAGRLARPTLVHSANVAFESMVSAAEQIARNAGAPHVVSPFLHLGEGAGSRVWRYYTMPHQVDLLCRADAVVVLTTIERDALAGFGVRADRLHVVGAGIDVSASTGGDAAAARRRIGVDGPIVLALGAAAYDKGTMHLVQAAAALRRSGAQVTVVVAGPIMSEFDRFLASREPADRSVVRSLGFVSEEERRDLLAAADLLALPSRTESFGLVFLEAWANGKPVIGARAGAIPAVVDDGEDGVLVGFGDVSALSEAIRLLVEDPSLRNRLGERGRTKVVDEGTWYARVRDVYRQVLGGDPTPNAVGMDEANVTT